MLARSTPEMSADSLAVPVDSPLIFIVLLVSPAPKVTDGVSTLKVAALSLLKVTS